MSRSLDQTIAALNDSDLSVEVSRSDQRELTLSLRDPRNGFRERKSFLPGHAEKAASWLHGTAIRGCPNSRYAKEARTLELHDQEGAESASAEMTESIRQGATGLG